MPAKSRRGKILAIDWDARTLRVAHAVLGKQGAQIDRLLSVAIPNGVDPANPEQMGRHISRVLDEAGIGTKHAIVDVPRDQAILNTLKLPCRVPDELPDIVQIQIAKQLPFAVTDAVVDFAVAPHDADAVTADVLVAAVRHEVLSQYEATFATAGLKLERIGLRPYANKVATCMLLRHAMPERVLFIDVGPTLTEINILRNSFLSFSRAASVAIPKDLHESPRLSLVLDESANKSGDEPEDGAERLPARALDDVITSLVVEVTRSIEAYRADDPGAKMDHVVIGGDLGVEEALAEALQSRLDVTTEIYNPASSFGWEPDEGGSATAYAAALGLVLGHGEEDALRFDFLHPRKTVSQARQRLKKAPLVAAVVLLFLAAAGVAIAQFTKPKRDELATIGQAIRDLQVNTRQNEKFMSVLAEVRKFERDQQVWADVLYDIVANLPPQEELVITQLEMIQGDDRIVLKTRTKHIHTATETILSLEAFRRDGSEEPRFKGRIGTQTEKTGELYPFVQDLRIRILDDQAPPRRSRDSRREE